MDVNFYYIKPEYIDFLKRYEKQKRGITCVPNVEYKGKTPKFTYGTVFRVNDINYYAPVSHYSKEQQDLILLRDKKNPNLILGSLRFNYMIPVPNECCIKLDLNTFKSDAKRTHISKELAFCRRNREKIALRAEKTYYRVINNLDADLSRNSCDFKLLEEAYREFCGLAAPKQDQSKTVEVTQYEADKTLDAVIEILDETIAEKNEAISERNKAIAERDEVLAEFKQFRSEAMANSEEFNAIMKENPALKAAFKAARERHLESKDQKPTMPDKSAPNDTQTVKPKKPKR